MKRKNELPISKQAYEKYVKPSADREKMRKLVKSKSWWLENWIALVSLAVAIISLLVSVIALLM